jgi:hypothetical protein
MMPAWRFNVVCRQGKLFRWSGFHGFPTRIAALQPLFDPRFRLQAARGAFPMLLTAAFQGQKSLVSPQIRRRFRTSSGRKSICFGDTRSLTEAGTASESSVRSIRRIETETLGGGSVQRMFEFLAKTVNPRTDANCREGNPEPGPAAGRRCQPGSTPNHSAIPASFVFIRVIRGCSSNSD